MKSLPLVVSISLLMGFEGAAEAQMNMPGMAMPARPVKTRKAKSARKASKAKKAAGHAVHQAAASGTIHAGPSQSSRATEPQMPGMTMPQGQTKQSGHAMSGMASSPGEAMPGMAMPPLQSPSRASPAPTTKQSDMGQMQMGEQKGHNMGSMPMTGALGRYPMERESSGTAWQPDSSEHQGLMAMRGGWTLMAHGTLNLVFDHQYGPRGNDKAFVSGMLMGMARHPLGNGSVQFKAMVSPDPIMGARGYPLLLASGETANGRDRLIDRQHPHDFFMELSGSVSQNVGRDSSAFIYAGLPGEPAFGPPAFMHREAIMDSPEAPISHHWLDSTHISFGVLTAGVVIDRLKVEVSRFNGREPDQHRWDIETGPLNSMAVRLSWNPTRTLSLQTSWGRFKHPEQLEPGVDQTRWSASALWADEVAPGWKVASTLAWGRKSSRGHNDDAFVAEAAVKHARWTLFGRGEMIENRELTGVEEGPAYRVGKISIGTIRDFAVAEHLSVGAGALLSVNVVPDRLALIYGANNPTGAMGFARLKLN